jgi:hypothetical protein
MSLARAAYSVHLTVIQLIMLRVLSKGQLRCQASVPYIQIFSLRHLLSTFFPVPSPKPFVTFCNITTCYSERLFASCPKRNRAVHPLSAFRRSQFSSSTPHLKTISSIRNPNTRFSVLRDAPHVNICCAGNVTCVIWSSYSAVEEDSSLLG